MHPRQTTLLSQLLDGALVPTAEAALRAELARDPAFRREALLLLEQDRILDVLLGEDREEALARQVLAELRASEDEDRFVAGVAKAIAAPKRPRSSRRQRAGRTGGASVRRQPERRSASASRSSTSHVALWIWSAAAAAVVVLLALHLNRAPVEQVQPEPLEPLISALEGAPVLLRSNGQAVSADRRVLAPGEALVTARGQSAGLTYSDGTRVRLLQDSRLALPAGQTVAGKQFELESGQVQFAVTPQPSGSPLRIRTPQAVLTVVGTTFRVRAGGEGTRLEVDEGCVQMQRLEGGPLLAVTAGEAAVAGPLEGLALVSESPEPPAEPEPQAPPVADAQKTDEAAKTEDAVKVVDAAGVADAKVDDFLEGMHGDLPYRLFVPKVQEKPDACPLVLYLHGAGEKGTDNRRQLSGMKAPLIMVNAENQREFPCYLLAPQMPADVRVWDDIQNRLLALLDALQDRYPIDADRIYVTGISLGGAGVWSLLQKYPERFAAGAPMSSWTGPLRLKEAGHLPIWHFHGANDKTVSNEGVRAAVARLQKSGAPVRITLYPGRGHDIWFTAYAEPEFMPWLMSQKRVRSE